MSTVTTSDFVDSWLELDDTIDVPDQSLDEILADKILTFDDDKTGISDEESSLLTSPNSMQLVPQASYTLDSPIQINLLESISYQLKSNQDHINSGFPASVACSLVYVVVGTTRGYVLLFDRNSERLVSSTYFDGLPISCLDFTGDELKLIVGFSTGHIRVVNVKTLRVLEEVNDVMQPGSGILQATSNFNGRQIIALNSGGSVFELVKHSRLKGRRIRCLFSGCHGEAVHLRLIANDSLLVILSLRKAFFISLPKAKLVFTAQLNGPPNAPPLIEWSLDRPEKPAIRHLIVCLARGSLIKAFRVETSNFLPSKFELIRTIQLDHYVVNMKWINDDCIIAFDNKEKVHLISYHYRKELSVKDVPEIELTYGITDFKGLSSGGNVSKALEYLSSSVCYQSIKSYGSSVYILGSGCMYELNLLDEISQIDAFIDRNDVLSATLYAIDIYTGKVRNLKSKVESSRSISNYFPVLLQKLLETTMSGLDHGRVVHLINHYRMHINILIKACISTSRFDLLYSVVYPSIEKDPLSKTIFLEFLDDIIIDGLLEDPPPALVAEYLRNLVAEGQLDQYETSIVHIPVNKLDIHNVITFCRANKLYNGIVYIYNNVFGDYLSPLEEMLLNLSEILRNEVLSDFEIAQGNKLLHYIHCCLCGKAYPTGSLSEPLKEKVPLEIYRCLVSVIGKDGSLAETKYPYICLLLKFDAQQFLNIILSSSDSLLLSVGGGRLQRLVEIVYESSNAIPKNIVLLTHILCFLAKLRQKNAIFSLDGIISELVEVVLTSENEGLGGSESDQCIIDLMHSMDTLDDDRILRLAERRKRWKICGYIYSKRRQFKKFIECQLWDAAPQENVFTSIHDLLEELSGQERSDVLCFLRSILVDLCVVNGYETACLVLNYFPDWLNEVAVRGENRSSLIIWNCFSIRSKGGYHDVTGDENIDEVLFCLAAESLFLVPDGRSIAEIDEELAKSLKYWLPIGSRSDRCLNFAVIHSLFRSTIVLMEARNLIDRAIQMLYDELEKRLQITDDYARKSAQGSKRTWK
ncbi:hypothetical protein AB6A40_003422 [Gnathostoma spinigerum]|uniref:Vacuolar protein sorting-associated protein 8 central domain-containing protein n=1 Tax=Gnathostoma spinigerum TaxID=75299 RepID=A0ABD6E9N8_9BILA